MNQEIATLKSILLETKRNLQELFNQIELAVQEDIALLGKTKRSALIMAGLYENWYTCIETAFFRISQQFENNLQKERWHHSLLSTMTLHIQGVRIAAVSPENYNYLLEIFKFRHFKRYYFQIDYDWKKMEYILEVIKEAHPRALKDIDNFIAFLTELIEKPEV